MFLKLYKLQIEFSETLLPDYNVYTHTEKQDDGNILEKIPNYFSNNKFSGIKTFSQAKE